MLTVIRRYVMRPGTAEASARKVEQVFVPVFRALDGAVSYHLLKMDGDVMISVMTFRDAEVGDELSRRVGTWVRENIGPDIVSGPEREEGETLLYALGPDGSPSFVGHEG